MNAKVQNKSMTPFFVYTSLLFINLLFLFYIKYHNQNLGLTELSLGNFGNLLNVIFFALLLIGLLILSLKRNALLKSPLLISIIILNFAFLILSYLSTTITFPFSKIYWFSQNGNKLFSGLSFTLYQLTYFILIFIVWAGLIAEKKGIFIKSLISSLTLMLLFLVASFIYIQSAEKDDDEDLLMKDSSPVIVVLGAAVWSDNKPSPSLAARVDKAASIMKTIKVDKLYLTGSNAPGELAESKVAFDYLKTMVDNVSNVRIETNTTSTNEQIQFIKNDLLKKDSQNIYVISDRYHLVRINEISKFHNMKIKLIASDLKIGFSQDLSNKFREAIGIIMFWFFAL